MTLKRLKILMLCADRSFEELFRQIVSNCELILIQDIEGCLGLINKKTFDILILTNLSIPIDDVISYVKQLPEKRYYKAFVITGYVNQELIDMCKDRAVPIINLPIDAEEIEPLLSDKIHGIRVAA